MGRILIRSGKSPETVLSPEASLAASKYAVFGTNSGNLLFSSSVTRSLSVDGTEVVSDSLLTERREPTRALADRINAEFDAFVVPLANAFRPQFAAALGRLTRLIEQLRIPVVVVGVGTQLPVGGDLSAADDALRDASRAFVRAVLERSASIGVRGEVTERFVRDLGFPADVVDVIGCPSIFDAGRTFAIEKKVEAITQDSAIAFNTALANPGAGRFVQRITRDHPNSVFIGQSNLELALLLWGTTIRGQQAGVPATVDHPLFLQDRLRFFVDPGTWIRFLGERDFSIGARIHGNVAALLGGTPAVVLAADSRTLELADYHAIPYRITPRLDDPDLDVARIHDEIDFTEFNRRVPEHFDRYVAFLDRNGLPHAAGSDERTAAFDARMARLAFPGPVRSPMGPDGTRLLLDRLRWLRQDGEVEDARRAGAYVPPFDPAGVVAQGSLAGRVAELERTMRALQAESRRPLSHAIRRRAVRIVRPLRDAARTRAQRRP